jgi:hypothetical protein
MKAEKNEKKFQWESGDLQFEKIGSQKMDIDVEEAIVLEKYESKMKKAGWI